MFITTPTICNVKISFAAPKLTNENLYLLREMSTRLTQSYYVIKTQYTFTIYFNCKIINITGIQHFDLVLDAIRAFKDLIKNQSVECENIKIDNSTAFGRYFGSVDFFKIQNCLPIGYNIKFTPLFPGAFVELRNKKKILIFKSGKYISVGCKSRASLKSTFEELKALYINYNQHESFMRASRNVSN